MSLQSVPPGEMGTHDHDDELEGFFEELRAAFPARSVASEDEHVAAMVSTAHLLADKGDPVVRPASNADAPAPQVSRLPKQRRNRMWDKKLSERNWTHGVALKVLAPATVFFMMLGGVAWAGGLPQPLQKTAAHVASFAGLTIEDGTDVDTQDPAETDVQEPTSTDTQDGDAQGEDTSGDTSTDNNQDGDSQGEDPSGDATDNQDGDSQGEDTSGDTSSTDGEDGDTQGDGSGDSTSGGDTQGDGTQDSSGDGSSQDSAGDGSGSSGGDGQS